MSKKPNILFFHVDNLGMGELGCYGGGKLRGADTKRIDAFCKEGTKLTHYVVEPQCTPTRLPRRRVRGSIPVTRRARLMLLTRRRSAPWVWSDVRP